MSAASPEPEDAPAAAERRWLAGVDEAGLGPILGPLVVAGVAMSGPPGVDPWRALAPGVCKARPRGAQLMVADSKKVKQGKYGMERLERTVLACFRAFHGSLENTLEDWLTALGVDTQPLARCPWYASLDLPLPLFGDADTIHESADGLEERLALEGIGIEQLVVRPLDVEEYNRSIQATDNKSTTHFQCYAEVLGKLLTELPGGAHLLADRAGGRRHYRSALRDGLPTSDRWRIDVIRETAAVSSYRLQRSGDAELQLTFASGGEDRAFPTALASCCAKYLRECLMTVLNRWFEAQLPGLRPTAGYYVDGNRFLDEVEPLVARSGLPRERLRRSR